MGFLCRCKISVRFGCLCTELAEGLGWNEINSRSAQFTKLVVKLVVIANSNSKTLIIPTNWGCDCWRKLQFPV